MIVETTIAFASSVFPGQLKHLQNDENIVIRDIYDVGWVASEPQH